MDAVRPKKGSRGSGSGGSNKSRSRTSSRSDRNSHKSDKSKTKSKTSSPIEGEKEVKFGDVEDEFEEEQGYIINDDTDTEEDSDPTEDQKTEDVNQVDVEQMEPYIDEDAVRAELGDTEANIPVAADEKSTTEEKDESQNKGDKKSTEEDEEELDTSGPKKKRGRRLKKITETKVGFDGREVVFVTDFTQTDWKWKDTAEKSGKGKLLVASSVKPDSRQTMSQARTEEESTVDDRTTTDLTPYSLQPNDEFGIPVLEMSDDSDSSEDESGKKKRSHKHHLPSIGPPQILKYIRESDRLDNDSERTSSSMEDEFRHLDSDRLVYDQDGNLAGMFSGPCEFCSLEIKPFPTLEQQLSQPPETLYCCEDYREFVEFAMNTANRLEEDIAKKNEKISIKVHPHHGSKQARKMAKEQAVQRMRERELQRRQQEATGLQNAYYQSAANQSGDTDDLEQNMPDTSRKTSKPKDNRSVKGKGDRSSAIRGGGEWGGSYGAGPAFPPTSGVAQSQFAAFPGFAPEVARQMKTINYQLSSQKCLEEGWTLRAPSPLDMDDLDNEVFVPEPLHPAMIATGKLQDRKLIEKFYPDSSKFVTIFPDGTGNVFYPSGRVAILIISISLGQYTYVVQDDCDEPEILAIFDPNGYGSCYFANGKVRLTYDQHGGMELDYTGGRKRSWNWRDQETHVHAPPFQPIVFGMNRYIGVRFMAQHSIALTLTGKKRSCRFNVGAKLKLVAPENIVPKGIDENHLFIDERKVKVDLILNKVTTLLKFPKCQKVDRILPPLSVASRQSKVDRMKQEYAASLALPATGGGRKQRKIGKHSRLSPIPFVSVN